LIGSGFQPDFLLSLGLKQIYFWYDQLLRYKELESHLEGQQATLSIAVALGDKKARSIKKKLMKEALAKVTDADSKK